MNSIREISDFSIHEKNRTVTTIRLILRRAKQNYKHVYSFEHEDNNYDATCCTVLSATKYILINCGDGNIDVLRIAKNVDLFRF